MKSKAQKKMTAMRTGLAALSAMTLMVVGMGPAWGDVATNGEAYAAGISATGLLPIPATPESRQSGEGRQATGDVELQRDTDAVLRVPLTGLAVDATLQTLAEVSFAGTINSTLAVIEANSLNPITLRDVNVHAYAAANNVDVLTQVPANLDPAVPLDLFPQITQALVNLDGIEAEAVAKCVNNVAQFDTGYNILSAQALGIDLGLVQNVLSTVLDTVTALLPGIVQLQKGVEEDVPNGKRITALRVNILNGTQVLNIATAEAKMTNPCGVRPPEPPKAQLAVTGGGGMSSLLGAGLLMAAVLTIVLLRRSQIQE